MEKDFYIKRLPSCKDLPLPKYMTAGSVGMDLYANVLEDTVINTNDILLVGTGICIQLPYGYEAQIRPRSGLALKHGITLVNSPGTIDFDYRGEIGIILINHGKLPFVIERGQRICQMVINKVEIVEFTEIDELDNTKRGAGGFGHTRTL